MSLCVYVLKKTAEREIPTRKSTLSPTDPTAPLCSSNAPGNTPPAQQHVQFFPQVYPQKRFPLVVLRRSVVTRSRLIRRTGVLQCFFAYCQFCAPSSAFYISQVLSPTFFRFIATLSFNTLYFCGCIQKPPFVVVAISH